MAFSQNKINNYEGQEAVSAFQIKENLLFQKMLCNRLHNLHPESKIFSRELLVKHHQAAIGHREGFLGTGNLALVHTGCLHSQNAWPFSLAKQVIFLGERSI